MNSSYTAPGRLPHLGRRIIKTTAAVFICLLIYYFRGYAGEGMPVEAAITAIICMQPYVRDTRAYAITRFIGSLIGLLWALAFLLLLMLAPRLSFSMVIVYAVMACGVMLSLYSAVLLGMPDASALAAIVFLCVVAPFPDIDRPLFQAMQRILDVLIGTAVAVLVNVAQLPRTLRRGRVFFVRMRDIAPDRFSQLSSAALFTLNRLFDDGARICLMSEHAPAYLTLQMSMAKPNTPFIVMDGAAIYDAAENRFLHVEHIGTEDSERLRERMDALGLSYFIYTVRRNRTCIFHSGRIAAAERVVYDQMRGSPYRSYLDGEICDPGEIVYFKLIAGDGKVAEIEHSLSKSLPRGRLRAVVRPQSGAEGISALYIYPHTATMERAQKRLMELLRADDPELDSCELRPAAPCRGERDTMQFMSKLTNACEPVRLFGRGKKKA